MEGLKDGGYVLFAFKTNGDSHIRTVLRFEPNSDSLVTYDPSPLEAAASIPMTRDALALMWPKKLNADLLSIRRKH